MRNPIAFIRRVREALQRMDEADAFVVRATALLAKADAARRESRRALCPICQHGEIALAVGALDDRGARP